MLNDCQSQEKEETNTVSVKEWQLPMAEEFWQPVVPKVELILLWPTKVVTKHKFFLKNKTY
jgi:hypothetical protein